MAHWQGERSKRGCERSCTGTDEEVNLLKKLGSGAYAFRNGLTTGTPPSTVPCCRSSV
jgi:hypothetical protein